MSSEFLHGRGLQTLTSSLHRSIGDSIFYVKHSAVVLVSEVFGDFMLLSFSVVVPCFLVVFKINQLLLFTGKQLISLEFGR